MEDHRIIYYDKDYICLDKPAGMLSEGSEGSSEKPVCTILSGEFGKDLFLVHRLDRMTSGAMIVARSKAAASAISEIITCGAMIKEYYAVVEGETPQKGTLCDSLYFDRRKNKSFVVRPGSSRKGVKDARLEYSLVSSVKPDDRTLSLVSIRLFTGRTHQIRVQMSHAGHPLLGDGKYGSRDNRCSVSLVSRKISFDPELTAGKQFGKTELFRAFEKNNGLLTAEIPDRYPWDLF